MWGEPSTPTTLTTVVSWIWMWLVLKDALVSRPKSCHKFLVHRQAMATALRNLGSLTNEEVRNVCFLAATKNLWVRWANFNGTNGHCRTWSLQVPTWTNRKIVIFPTRSFAAGSRMAWAHDLWRHPLKPLRRRNFWGLLLEFTGNCFKLTFKRFRRNIMKHLHLFLKYAFTSKLLCEIALFLWAESHFFFALVPKTAVEERSRKPKPFWRPAIPMVSKQFSTTSAALVKDHQKSHGSKHLLKLWNQNPSVEKGCCCVFVLVICFLKRWLNVEYDLRVSSFDSCARFSRDVWSTCC